MGLSRKASGMLAASLIFGILCGLIAAWLGVLYVPAERLRSTYQMRLAHKNFSVEVAKFADELELPYAYFMALTVLECSGEKPCDTRFENHVYERLEQVRVGERERYGKVRQPHIHDATDDALRNLATSWGPFQLMGYKCIDMSVHVADIRGKDAVRHGMRWISEEYGGVLREGSFKDAFHIHNAGRPYPKIGPPRTHDPRYVERGLRYMDYFASREP
jgi:hypothetical protein